MTKTCVKCGEEKDLADFYSRSRNKDKLSNKCKLCVLASQIRVLPPEFKNCIICLRTLESSKFYKDRTRPDGLDTKCYECNNVIAKDWYENNKERYNDRSKVYHAKRADYFKELNRAWRETNADVLRIKQQEYYANNRDIILQKNRIYGRLYYANNKEKVSTYSSKWKLENKEKVNQYTRKRRFKIRTAGGDYTYDQLYARIDYYGEMCYLCGGPFEAIDHVIPVSLGGTNWPANLRPICTPCNSKKRNTHPLKAKKVKK